MAKTYRPLIHPAVPLALIGPPGIGKTAYVTSHAREDYPVRTLILTMCDPPDVAGALWPEGKVTRRLLPDWFEYLMDTKKGGILFIDELTQAPPSLQAPALRLINERAIDRAKLPDNVCIVTAFNPPDTIQGGYELSSAMANRLRHHNFKLIPEEWIEGMMTGWNKKKSAEKQTNEEKQEAARLSQARSNIAAYIQRNRSNLMMFPTDEAKRTLPWPSPRSWDNAAKQMAADMAQGLDPAESLHEIVGEGAASAYLTWRRHQDLPEPESLLANTTLARKVLKDAPPDRVGAILASCFSAFQSDVTKDRWNACMEIVEAGAANSCRDMAMIIASPLLHLRHTSWPMPKSIPELVKFAKTANIM